MFGIETAEKVTEECLADLIRQQTQDVREDIRDLKLEIRLTNQRIDTISSSLGKRIDALNQSMNQRMDSTNQRLDKIIDLILHQGRHT